MPQPQPHRIRLLRSAIAAEDGFVLPTAILVLLVVTLLTAAAVTASISNSSTNTRDQHSKAALEAAEAGLRIATYRLNMISPATYNCIEQSVEVGATGGVSPNTYCEDKTTESLGNGATFKYWTTPEMTAKSTCVGMTMTDTEEERAKNEGIAQRCITAEGVANGVATRVQARVAQFTAKPLFPVPAIIGKKSVEIEGATIINSSVASNGKVISKGEKATQYGSCELGPSAGYEGSKGENSPCKTVKQRTIEEGEIPITSVEPGSSATGTPTGECAIEPKPKYNCDFRVENGIYNASKKLATEYKTPYDQISGNVTYTTKNSKGEATREMKMSGGGSWTLGEGIYNFCSFEGAGNSTLTVAAGAKAEIFIEAPESEEKGSGCPAGTGNFSFTGTINNPSGDPTALQIYVYGKGPVTYSGNTSTAMTLYAPESTVTLTGSSTLSGGITGKEIKMSGSFTFDWDGRVKKLKSGEAGAVGAYYRTAWAQCTSTSTTPLLGC